MGRLSVIVPVYGVEHTLGRCLRSIVSQTYRDIEIVLVDDGSPDACPAMCDEWAAADSRIRVIHKDNGGLSSARNAGLAVCSGEWVTFVDSDDWLEPDTYEEGFHALEQHRAETIDMVEFPYESQGHLFRDPQPSGIVPLEGRVGEMWLQHRWWRHPAMWCKVFRRTLFDGLSFPDGEVHEDIFLLPQLMLRMRGALTIDRGLYHYTYNENGICRTPSAQSISIAIRNHLRAAEMLGVSVSDEWYLSLVDMQVTLWRTGYRHLAIPSRRVSPFSANGCRQAVKACVLNILGLKSLCRLLS